MVQRARRVVYSPLSTAHPAGPASYFLYTPVLETWRNQVSDCGTRAPKTKPLARLLTAIAPGALVTAAVQIIRDGVVGMFVTLVQRPPLPFWLGLRSLRRDLERIIRVEV
jgi:hypothetical protein